MFDPRVVPDPRPGLPPQPEEGLALQEALEIMDTGPVAVAEEPRAAVHTELRKWTELALAGSLTFAVLALCSGLETTLLPAAVPLACLYAKGLIQGTAQLVRARK